MISESARSDSRLTSFFRKPNARDEIAGVPFRSAHAAIRCAGDDDGDNGDNRRPGDGDQLGIATKTRAKPKKPSQFKVLMLNDDYTPMEFVVLVLKRFFNMDMEAATRVMLHVHQKGVGVCGIFPYEIAETKVNQVMDFAKEHQHPLQCTLEKA
jgi:ATP-dependent Clp protease adaptor protein ClpS